MNPQEYERMYRLEETYWWFVGRHHLVIDYLRERLRSRDDLTLLDIGCGTGAMAEKLGEFGSVVAADFSPLALSFSKRRSIERLCAADAMRLPFRDASFDVIVSLDTLEHLPDDQAALCEYARVLKPGGCLVATVPAYKSLWSGHDVALMHFRRYVAKELAERCVKASLKVIKLSYAMTALFPIVWLARKLSNLRGAKAEASLVEVSPRANRLLTAILRAENAVVRRMRLPFGVTVFCVAERPGPLGE